MQSTAIALGKHGIRCNSVLPGTILTEINKDDLADVEKRKYMEKRTPARPPGRLPKIWPARSCSSPPTWRPMSLWRGVAGRWRLSRS
jgi:NAD(P)-dependent dehydrogenase (short-subunit alcohol dehydrogenase family)